jgi:branched-chain amino acid transport system ATP-binding protein
VANLLSVASLSLAFGGIQALDGVDLGLEEGSITGLIGPNGAGKTSLLNCISGFYRPQRGRILLESADLLRLRPHQIVAHGVARTLQRGGIFAGLTVLDNILVGAHTRGRPGVVAEALALPAARRAAEGQRQGARELLRSLGLEAYADHHAGSLPLGIQKRIGLTRSLASHPRLLLLDEPAAGLNTAETRELGRTIASMREQRNLTVLLVEHDMELVMAVCDSVTVLAAGRRIAAGHPQTIRHDPEVISAYLGTA